MSPKNEIAEINFAPINEVPKSAPPMQIDISNPMLSFDDVFPSNYFSMADLEIWLRERKANARVLRVTGLSIEYVYDPEKGEDSGDWKPCFHFEDTPTMLVINPSRGQQLRIITGSPYVKDWANVREIAIRPGIYNGKAQIVIDQTDAGDPDWAKDPVPAAKAAPVDVDALNEELFG